MAWFDELHLPGALIDGYFGFVKADGPDEDDAPDVRLADGWATFKATTSAARVNGAWLGIQEVRARIFEGRIVVSEEDPRPVRLLATDANIGVADWAWTVTFDLNGFLLAPLTFKAPRDTTVNLTADMIPIKSQPYQIIEGASIVDAEEGEGEHAGEIRFLLSNGDNTKWIDVPNGEKGDKGDRGATGARGPAGEAATLELGSVATGPAAEAWMTGTAQARELNLVLPRGPKGDPGPAADLTGYAKQSWVTEQIGKIPRPDLTGYATEDYVDDAIANLGVPEGAISGMGVSQIVVVTQAEYDALLPQATTLYLIREA